MPLQRLEFVLRFADKDGSALDPATIGTLPGVPKAVRHVITFEDTGGDRTRLTVTEFGYAWDQAVDLSRAGLEQCLDKMGCELRHRIDPSSVPRGPAAGRSDAAQMATCPRS